MVVQLANFSMDHVIDALAVDVIITRTQTINRAWNFESLENMPESFHTDRRLQRWDSKTWSSDTARYKGKKTTLRSNQSTRTISALVHTNVALKKQTNGNGINNHDCFNKYLMKNRVYIVIEPK